MSLLLYWRAEMADVCAWFFLSLSCLPAFTIRSDRFLDGEKFKVYGTVSACFSEPALKEHC